MIRSCISLIALVGWSQIVFACAGGSSVRPSTPKKPIYCDATAITEYDNQGYTFFHRMAANWPISILTKCDFQECRDVEVRAKRSGALPIHCAAACGNIGALKRLAQCRGHLDFLDQAGQTPLMYALATGEESAAHLLLELGASCSAVGKSGMSTLDVAVCGGKRSLIANVLRIIHPDQISLRGALSEVVRCDIRDARIVDLLVRAGAKWSDAHTETDDLMTDAYALGHFNAIKSLVEAGFPAGGYVSNWSPLHAFAADGKYDLVEFLLDYGADANDVRFPSRGTLIDTAVLSLDAEADYYGVHHVAQLIRRLCHHSPNQCSAKALCAAALNGHKQIIDELIAAGVSVDARITDNGVTPLMCAALADRDQIVHHLVKKGADIALQDREGMTALHVAVRANSLRSLATLVKVDRKTIAVRNQFGRDPLLESIVLGSVGSAGILMMAWPRGNTRPDASDTAHIELDSLAASCGHMELSKMVARWTKRRTQSRTTNNTQCPQLTGFRDDWPFRRVVRMKASDEFDPAGIKNRELVVDRCGCSATPTKPAATPRNSPSDLSPSSP